MGWQTTTESEHLTFNGICFQSVINKTCICLAFIPEHLCSDSNRQIKSLPSLNWQVLKVVYSEVSSFCFGSKPPFAHKTILQKSLWKSPCYNVLFATIIAVEEEVVVAAITIALLRFTRFWCTQTHVESKPLCSKTPTSEVGFPKNLCVS